MGKLKDLYELLCKFNNFCLTKNIKYCLAWGTLLGCIRHKGFIPWDDDIDLFIYQKDEMKLIRAIENSDDFILINHYNGKNFIPCSSTEYVYKKNRTFYKLLKKNPGKSAKDYLDTRTTDAHGNNVIIDIMVIDPIPEDDSRVVTWSGPSYNKTDFINSNDELDCIFKQFHDIKCPVHRCYDSFLKEFYGNDCYTHKKGNCVNLKNYNSFSGTPIPNNILNYWEHNTL